MLPGEIINFKNACINSTITGEKLKNSGMWKELFKVRFVVLFHLQL